jgi:hypothetical protein
MMICFFLRTTTVLALVSTAAVSLAAQVQTVDITPQATFGEPFSSLVGVRALADGRLLIADRIERHVSYLDFDAGTVQQIGREGGGPGEYSSPIGLFALPNGETLLADIGNTRITTISANGSIGTSIPMIRQESDMMFIRPQGTDDRGRIYFSTSGVRMAGPDAHAAPADSAPILRLDPATDRFDTVGMVAVPRGRRSGTAPMRLQGGMSVRVAGSMPGPYAAQDEWSVHGDGTVVVARANGYRLDRYTPDGRHHTGAETPYAPVRVTRAVKEAWADAQTQNVVAFRTDGGNGQSMRMSRPNVDEVEFPEYLPAVARDGVMVTTTGDVWVRRSVEPNRRPSYDVFDGSGRLMRRVELGPRRRVVGFGNGVMYAVATDEGDLQWLERYAVTN